MIRFQEVSRSFASHRALENVSLEIEPGTMLGIMGPGGCGKSTFCRMACGLLLPDFGKVFFNGHDLYAIDRQKRLELQSRCGVQFQNDALFEHMTVVENITYPLTRLTKLSRGQMYGKAVEQLAMVGLSGFEDRSPSRLSGGQRRRVALARACVTQPDVLICDDPTAGLDPVTSRKILDMIAGIRYQAKNTVIIVSSDVFGLMSVSDRIALIWDGQIVAHQVPALLAQDPNVRVKRFLDDARLPIGVGAWE